MSSLFGSIGCKKDNELMEDQRSKVHRDLVATASHPNRLDTALPQRALQERFSVSFGIQAAGRDRGLPRSAAFCKPRDAKYQFLEIGDLIDV